MVCWGSNDDLPSRHDGEELVPFFCSGYRGEVQTVFLDWVRCYCCLTSMTAKVGQHFPTFSRLIDLDFQELITGLTDWVLIKGLVIFQD